MTEDLKLSAWLRERFGGDGQTLVGVIPQLLEHCHTGMAEAQVRAPIKSHGVYGQMWRAVHDGLEELNLLSLQLVRPARAPYRVPVIKGTALFPWRYARDVVSDVDQASFGRNVSETRKAVLRGLPVAPLLPFDEDVKAEATPDDEDIARHRADFRAVATKWPVVLLAYASSPAGLHAAHLGDAKGLNADGSVDWGFRHKLDLAPSNPPRPRLTVVKQEQDSGFAGGRLQEPAVRSRRSDQRKPHSES